MRLIKYLSYSTVDEDVNKFRSMSISLTKQNEEVERVLKNIYEKYDIEQISPYIDNLNKELRKIYNGKFEFSLCYESEKKISTITDNKRKTEPLTLALFEANDKFSRIKSKLETIIKNKMNE